MSNDIPQDISEIAELLTDLETAFLGKPSAYQYEIKTLLGRTEYFIGTPEPNQFMSLDWIAIENNKETLPLWAEISDRNYYAFPVTPDLLPALKTALRPKIKELNAEYEVNRKAELKADLKAAFARAWNITPDKAASMGLKEDLGERTPTDLIQEVVIAHLWLNPDERGKFPEAKTFFNDLAKTLDDADTEKLFDIAERDAIMKTAGEQFIATRKLKNTIAELGEDIHTLHPKLLF